MKLGLLLPSPVFLPKKKLEAVLSSKSQCSLSAPLSRTVVEMSRWQKEKRALVSHWPWCSWNDQFYYPTAFCSFLVNNIVTIDNHVYLLAAFILWYLPLCTSSRIAGTVASSITVFGLLFLLYLFHFHLDQTCVEYVREPQISVSLRPSWLVECVFCASGCIRILVWF